MSATLLTQVAVHLRPEDNIAVAARNLQGGLELEHRGKQHQAGRPGRHGAQVRPGADRQGRGDSQVRPDHRLRQGGHCGRRPCPRPQRGRRCLRARLRFLPGLPAAAALAAENRTFLGYDRGPDRPEHQRYGTRNYIAIISTVNCSASTSKYISERFHRTDLLKQVSERGRRPGHHAQGRAAPCSMTGPITTSSTAPWPGLPSIPTSRPTSWSALAARRARRCTWSRTKASIQLELIAAKRQASRWC